MANMPLLCTNCGAKMTYADAHIADIHKSCDGQVTHEWLEVSDE
jgi:hypothetical protein